MQLELVGYNSLFFLLKMSKVSGVVIFNHGESWYNLKTDILSHVALILNYTFGLLLRIQRAFQVCQISYLR